MTKTEMMNLAAEYEARVVGYIEQTRDYRWKLDGIKTESELDEIIKSVKTEDAVAG